MKRYTQCWMLEFPPFSNFKTKNMADKHGIL